MEQHNDQLVEKCYTCNGTGLVIVYTSDCCGMVHELGYCAGHCAVPLPVEDYCPNCGGAGGFPEEPRNDETNFE